jgi:hypothetical protein
MMTTLDQMKHHAEFLIKTTSLSALKNDAAQSIKITSSNLVRDFINASRKGGEDGKGTINIQPFLAQSFSFLGEKRSR